MFLDQYVSIGTHKNGDHTSALYDAYCNADEETFRSLLEKTAPMEALEWAAKRGWNDVLQDLVDKGLNVDGGRTEDGRVKFNPLIAAIDTWKHETVKFLLEELGANPNVVTTSGLTPLVVATQKAINSDAIGMLLKHGAKPDQGLIDALNAKIKRYERAGNDVGALCRAIHVCSPDRPPRQSFRTRG